MASIEDNGRSHYRLIEQHRVSFYSGARVKLKPARRPSASTNDKMSVLNLSQADCEKWYNKHNAYENSIGDKRAEAFYHLCVYTLEKLGFKALRWLVEMEIDTKEAQGVLIASIISQSIH